MALVLSARLPSRPDRTCGRRALEERDLVQVDVEVLVGRGPEQLLNAAVDSGSAGDGFRELDRVLCPLVGEGDGLGRVVVAIRRAIAAGRALWVGFRDHEGDVDLFA